MVLRFIILLIVLVSFFTLTRVLADNPPLNGVKKSIRRCFDALINGKFYNPLIILERKSTAQTYRIAESKLSDTRRVNSLSELKINKSYEFSIQRRHVGSVKRKTKEIREELQSKTARMYDKDAEGRYYFVDHANRSFAVVLEEIVGHISEVMTDSAGNPLRVGEKYKFYSTNHYYDYSGLFLGFDSQGNPVLKNNAEDLVTLDASKLDFNQTDLINSL